MSLTDVFVKNLKAPEKPKKFTDAGGLYLYSTPKGLKSWRFDYRFQGRRLTLTIGTYPMVSLKEARDKLVDAKRSLKVGVDPGVRKKATNEALKSASLNSFEVVAREWFERKKVGKKEAYIDRIWGRVEKELLPFLASRDIAEIEAPELLEVLRKVESRGAVDTAHRCLQYSGQIFRYAIATGRIRHDVSGDLKGALSPAIHQKPNIWKRTSSRRDLIKNKSILNKDRHPRPLSEGLGLMAAPTRVEGWPLGRLAENLLFRTIA